MSVEINEKLAQRLRDEQVIWLTTIRSDGMPLPTPVWFYWDGNVILISTQTNALKTRNAKARPKVALNFNTNAQGTDIIVLQGVAEVKEQADVDPVLLEGYLNKYRQGMKYMNMTEEQFKQFSTAKLIVTPVRVRAGMM